MKKNITNTLIIAILFLFINGITHSQDTNPAEFLPLKVGNIWVYQIHLSGTYCMRTDRRRIKVIGTIILNSKKYFLFKDTTIFFAGIPGGMCPGGSSIPFDTLRIDSINGNIYKYSYQGCSYLNHEITLDSLKAKLNDNIYINCGLDAWYTCTDTSFQIIFGQSRQVKAFNHAAPPESYWDRKYAKGFGQSQYGLSAVFGYSNATLIGCVLDGVLYGDTSFITGIHQINSETPKSFLLSQNYPNPFNPRTNIRFQVAKLGDVKLVLSDALGKEIATLINEKLNPGTYEAEWDASNFASGVYFYKLITADYTETRNMVLVK
jgi:hypothetical protein